MEEKEKVHNCSDECTCGCNEETTCTCNDECNSSHCECEDFNCEENESNYNKQCECEEDECDCNEKKHHKKEKKDKYKKRINELEEKIRELETKNLSVQADMINYRKRKEEETAKMLKYASEDIVTDLLSTIDNFERAIKMDDDNLEDEVSKFLSGFKMIYCNLVSTLEKHEVKTIDEVNKEFDPAYHQAVMTEKIEGMEPGMIIEVLQKGYILKDKVIRTAMVKVSE